MQENIVAEYCCKGVTVRISDAAYAGLSEEQLQRNRQHAQRVASGILKRAMDRGEVEGISPEEWDRRYRKEGTGGGYPSTASRSPSP